MSQPGVSTKSRKTAVVVIHGMGEQWPMDTLRGFVEGAWTEDSDLVTARTDQIYSKPDRITGSFELRRITTRNWKGPDARRVDFFEFYWAHLMRGNGIWAVVGWLRRLLLRSPGRVPKRLLSAWILGLLATAALVVLLMIAHEKLDVGVPKLVLSVLALVLSAVSAVWVVPVLGDAARYLSPAPDNVGAREAIREAGMDLLAKLHASGDYDRIIIAGHSLGSVIGYDVLNHAWGRLDSDLLTAAHGLPGSPAMAALTALENAAGKLADKDAPEGALLAWRAAQRAYFAELAKLTDAEGKPLWLVSDFVTMGCPLSKADVLVGKDEADLLRRKTLREAPTSPPWLEKQKPPRFSYPITQPARTPHHAAVFAPTVWTNIYYPSSLIAFGDFISGPVAPQLGKGIRDVEVPIGRPWFRHLDYWAKPAKGGPAIRALRRALNLRLLDEGSLWGEQVHANPVQAECLGESVLAPVPVPAPSASASASASAPAGR